MGNWFIGISGVGQHHNSDLDANDANNLAKMFVEQLKESGQIVQWATFTHGGSDDITNYGHKPS